MRVCTPRNECSASAEPHVFRSHSQASNSSLHLAFMGGNPIQPEVAKLSTQYPLYKSKMMRHNHGIKASARRVCLFQILAIFGILICKSPLLVDGLARGADEKLNYLHVGPGDHSSDELVLRGSPYTVTLGRPSVGSLWLSNDEERDEILSVKLKLLRGKASAFRVFINLPEAEEETSIISPEFAGSYLHEPRRVKSPDFEYQVTMFSIGISDIIEDLGLMEQPSIMVTFVPCGADKELPVVLESVHIELA